jgi:hypothetical protein
MIVYVTVTGQRKAANKRIPRIEKVEEALIQSPIY